jgi:hypothetical protein
LSNKKLNISWNIPTEEKIDDLLCKIATWQWKQIKKEIVNLNCLEEEKQIIYDTLRNGSKANRLAN